MSAFDSVVVTGDFVSEHYLSEQFPTRVKALRKDWAEREEVKVATPRSGLTGFAGTAARLLASARERADQDVLRKFYRKTRRALLLDAEPEQIKVVRLGAAVEVDGVAHRTASGLHLVILQAMDAHTVEDILDWNAETEEGLGRLLAPATIDGKPEPGLGKVISGLFLAEEPPRLVLVQAGGWLLLTYRERWPEGRWLAVDLATAAERKDVRSAGELETIAALVGSDGLLPREDGSCGLDEVLEESIKHAVGVSKDLREGVRESVELVANEIVARRRRAGLPVDGLSDLPLMLQKQALRFLYRILFLLYAEARPELEIVPAKAPEYAEGYGLDRLRDLALVELTERRSLDGTHFYESLHKLFQLVDQGHEADDDGLPFEALRADLFAEGAISLIDAPSNVDENWDPERGALRVRGVGLGNQCLQTVLRKLLLSKPTRGRDAGFVSYAQLGINQLGAVYEGLMSYSGFLAEEDLYEVAKGGDPSKGTWVVNAEQAQELSDEVFVRDEDPETGEPRRRLHRKGTFVYRLSGRERQRSASYYTPEVLTRCVVKHSLAELLDQGGERTPAARILEYTVCEPALGSGAFLIEAVNQLAEEYLKRRQEERGEVIEPERYALELQRVKAYLSLHQCYGVDLNGTAVELAEVSLWLNAMHAGLRAPWFGLHLRRGNSLIGGRRAVYDVPPKKAFKWLDVVPKDLPINGDVPLGALGTGRVHHFLLPAKGWGAVADTKEANELVPEEVAKLKKWRSAVRKAPNAKQRERLHALARRVESLWSLAAQRLEIAEEKISRQADVWGAPEITRRSNGVTREQVEEFLADENNSYRRLRRAMDAWCALWFWPTTADCEPPDWEDWLDGLEALLGRHVVKQTAEE
ncbi:DNA methyltransferase [Saccharopolyspora hattusasensis]|uniref:DNA methyltransferase n=1 Tax=Saccharopolyspora hattusasensis TaxID=1128679 RepID=UPI003D967D50